MNTPESGFKHGELTRKIIGIFFEVYNELGYGFLESVYEEALALALEEAGLGVERQVPISVSFRERVVGVFKCDIVVERSVMIEVKATSCFDQSHEAQLLNYLRATEIEVGILLNFGPKAEFKRMAFENTRKQIRVHLSPSTANSPGPAQDLSDDFEEV